MKHRYLLAQKENIALFRKIHSNAMTERQRITTLESLPNEILIDCLSYLNATDIFCAFDSLNSRFDHLIRHVPLYFCIDRVTNSKCIQCCTNILSNSQIKQQIISLNLWTVNTLNDPPTLFSFISLDQFPQLRTLTLTLNDLNDEQISQISSSVRLLTNLHYLDFKMSHRQTAKIGIALSSSTLRTLSIERLPEYIFLSRPFTSLTNLIIYNSSVEALCYFFEYIPGLEYLEIKHVRRCTYKTASYYTRMPSNHPVSLKRLVLNNSNLEFNDLETLFKRTPNLKLLMISTDYNTQIIDALRWEQLIKTRLSLLDVFKFIFRIEINKFKQFQTEFWQQQHHWYIEYSLESFQVLIYTMPYMSNEFGIAPNTRRFFNKSIDDANRFVNINILTLCLQVLTNNDTYHFENVKSLRIRRFTIFGDDYPLLEIKHIERLKMMVHLYNLIHLDISLENGWKSPSVLLKLLKEATNLSSLKIAKNTLFAMFKSRELCECLSKMIKKLEIINSTDHLPINSFRTIEICDIFFNMEEFRYYHNQTDDFEMILNQLSKLTQLRVFCCIIPNHDTRNNWLDNHKSELDLYPFTIKYELENRKDVV